MPKSTTAGGARDATATLTLGLVNVVSALISLFVMLFVARCLGPGPLGVSAVVLGIVTSIQAFLDIRFADVAGKLFEEDHDGAPSSLPGHRAGVLWVGLAGTAACALALAAAAIVIGPVLAGYFTVTTIPAWWFAAAALQLAFASIGSSAMYLLRFSGAFGMIGVCRLLLSGLNALAMTTVLSRAPDLGGYFMASFLGSLLGAVAVFAVFVHVWRRRTELTLFAPAWRSAFASFRRARRLLWYGNLLGYAKLLQRSADVLVVAWLMGDRATGFYRLARQVVDQGLAVLQEAFNEVNHPAFLRAFERRDWRAYRRRATILLRVSIAVTVLLLVSEALILPRIIPALLGADYLPIFGPIMILTVSFLFLIGLYPALWAAFLGTGRLGLFTAASYVGITVQYASVWFLFDRGVAGPEAAMIGHLAYYLFQMPLLILILRRRVPELFA